MESRSSDRLAKLSRAEISSAGGVEPRSGKGGASAAGTAGSDGTAGGRARSANSSGTAYAVVADLLEDDEEGVLCDTAYRYICLFGSSSLSGGSLSLELCFQYE